MTRLAWPAKMCARYFEVRAWIPTEWPKGASDAGRSMRSYRSSHRGQTARGSRLRVVRTDRVAVGALANLPGMWSYSLLRFFAQPACDQTRSRERTSGHCLRRTRGALALLLSGRRFCAVLAW